MAYKFSCYLVLYLLAASASQAQLCQGSLGDPIVNITFGSGANPGLALPGATTNYTFSGSDCPNDGLYAVRNSTIACFSSTWHTVSSDHTGNANGYFMIVNASFQPSAFYIDTVDLLCVNTTYEFAAWVLNLSKTSGCGGTPIQPNLSFQIERLDGTIIQTYNSGNITPTASPQWSQAGFLFQTPPSVSRVVLRLINNAPGGCGNDIALDDITFRPCGPKITSVIGGNVSTASFCQGKDTTILMSASASGFSNPFYQWQISQNGGSTWTDILNANSISYSKKFLATDPAGTYQFRLTATEAANATFSQCRVSSDIITVTINAGLVTTNVNTNSPVCVGQNATLIASGGNNYTWTGPNNFMANGSQVSVNNIQPAQAGKYYVNVTNVGGCSKWDSANVVVNAKPQVLAGAATNDICKGDSIQLSVTGGQNYLWSPVTGLSSATIANPKASPVDSIQYKVVVSNAGGCTDSGFVKVNVVSTPFANAGPDMTLISGQSIMLNGQVSATDSFYWSPDSFISDVHVLKPVVNPPADASYYLQVISNAGCGAARDTVNVKVYEKLIVPNAFSPNGDGINDTWNIPALQSYPKHEVIVYDRYGNIILKENAFKSWSGNYKGKPLPVGTYYFVITLQNDLPPVSGWGSYSSVNDNVAVVRLTNF